MDLYRLAEIQKMDLNKTVNIKADIIAKWDGQEYDLNKGAQVKQGVLVAWQDIHKGVEFYVTEVDEEVIASKEIKNPLEENDRGSAFASLTGRGRKTK